MIIIIITENNQYLHESGPSETCKLDPARDIFGMIYLYVPIYATLTYIPSKIHMKHMRKHMKIHQK